ncbi:hypothetical protein K490DRAFT_73060 [Saccharata proteae CBS 121410]|uniref:DUF676 domain-containing protein n=1 Tax=Saccharata proteae CBS 121410 TaxID=1314787 RepID=A0A9P4LZF6_9PEZI|nr:hypothetical protein K490DRAFT_73060 [Saccharata proteae CBS 121410]
MAVIEKATINGLPKLKLVRANTVKLLPSQIGGTSGGTPLPYTANPFQLMWSDLLLLFTKMNLLVGLFLPLAKDKLDEIYPDVGNFVSLFWQVVLTIIQVLFVVSLPFCLFVPVAWFMIYFAGMMAINIPIWWIVNGFVRELRSQAHIVSDTKHPEEKWVFINGVSVGRYWLQSNIDRLAETFGRPVIGIHNPTNGLIFDLVQCMVERNFSYSTQDIRDAYAQVKESLADQSYKKVIMILHSQGGIQGGLIVDWLLAEMPDDLLQKLEIYTFGCAANHFNNPHRSTAAAREAQQQGTYNPKDKAIRYIEHYANDGDFVANWGILNFTHVANRFMGRLFERHGTGHLLNQHYLDYMFPLGPDRRAMDTNDFMETEVDFAKDSLDSDREGLAESLCDSLLGEDPLAGVAVVNDVNSPVTPVMIASTKSVESLDRVPKVKDFSRLWLYRNGGSPQD